MANYAIQHYFDGIDIDFETVFSGSNPFNAARVTFYNSLISSAAAILSILFTILLFICKIKGGIKVNYDSFCRAKCRSTKNYCHGSSRSMVWSNWCSLLQQCLPVWLQLDWTLWYWYQYFILNILYLVYVLINSFKKVAWALYIKVPHSTLIIYLSNSTFNWSLTQHILLKIK